MEHTLMKLPFDAKALEPVISEETLQYHYGKHHQKYVDTLNSLIQGTEFEEKTLTEIIQTSNGAIFNNAAQVFNHDFYWYGFQTTKTAPSPALQNLIEQTFGSMEKLQEEFKVNALKNFGSGWTWIVLHNNKLEIMNTSNADNPLKHDATPLLTCDVWEHAYYIDYRNDRGTYVDKWWSIINWEFVSKNLAKAGNE